MMEKLKLNPEEYTDLKSNSDLDEGNIIVTADDEGTIRESLLSEIKDVPEGQERIVAEEVDDNATQRYLEQVRMAKALNHQRSAVAFLENQFMSMPDIPGYLLYGGGANEKRIPPRIVADNKYGRMYAARNPNTIIREGGSWGIVEVSPSEMTSLNVGGKKIENYWKPEALARNQGFYIDRYGSKKRLSKRGFWDNIVTEYDDEHGWHYRQRGWSEQSNGISRSIWGIQDGSSFNLATTAYIKFINGSVGKGITSLGYAMSALSPLLGDKPSQFLYNVGRSFNYTSDKMEDRGSAHFWFGEIFDGVGQFIPVALGMRMFKAAHFAKMFNLPMEQAQRWAFRSGLWSTRLFMAGEAGGGMHDALIQMGVPRKEAYWHSLAYFAAAVVSESMIPGNAVEKMFSNNLYGPGVIRNVVNNELKKKGVTKGLTNAGKASWLRSAMNRMDFTAHPVANMVYASFEESLEEVFEGIATGLLAPWQNERVRRSAERRARNTDRLYESGGQYFALNKEGKVRELSHEAYMNINEDLRRNNELLHMEEYMEEDLFDIVEPVSAFASTFLTTLFGLPASISSYSNAKQKTQENINKAILARQIALNPNTANEVRAMLEEYKAKGAFEQFNFTHDGKVADKSTGRVVADDMIDSFMEEIHLTAEAMQVFGMDQKEAMEAFNHDVEIFSRIANVITEVNEIDKILEMGLDKAKEDKLVDEKATEEALNERRKKLMEEYQYLAVPEAGERYSEVYKNKVLEFHIKDVLIDNMLLNRTAENKFNKNYDELSLDEKNKVTGVLENIKYNFVNSPHEIGNLLSILDITDGMKLGGYENHIRAYKNVSKAFFGHKDEVVSYMAKEMYRRHNQSLKEKGVFTEETELSDFIQKLEKNIASIEGLEGIDMRDVKDDFASVVTAARESLNEIMADYSKILANKQARRNIGNILERVNTALGQAGLSMGHISYYLSGTDLTGEQLASTMGMSDQLSTLRKGEFKQFEGLMFDDATIDVDNLTQEQITEALNMFANDPIGNLHFYSIDGTTLNLNAMMEEFMQRTEGDNVNDAQGEYRYGKDLAGVIYQFGKVFEIEQLVLPRMNETESGREANPAKHRPVESYSKEQLSHIQEEIASFLEPLLDRVDKLSAMAPNRKFGQNKRHIMDLNERFNILKAIQQTKISDNKLADEINDLIATLISDIGKRMETYTMDMEESERFTEDDHNDPFKYIYSDFIKNKAEENSMDLVIEIEGVITKVEEKLSGKLTEYIKAFMDVNVVDNPGKGQNIYDNRFEMDYIGEDALDYQSDEMKSDGYLLHPDRVPANLNTVVAHESNEVTGTTKWNIISYLDFINEAGKDGVPTIKEIEQAFLEVSLLLDGYSKRKSLHAKNLHSPTYEQKRVIMELIVNNKRKGLPLHYTYKTGETEKSFLIENAMYMRGYAGGGKTSIITPYFFLTLAQINKATQNRNDLTVKVFTPTQHLYSEYKYGSMLWVGEVMKEMGVDFNVDYATYKDHMGRDYDTNMDPKADIIVFDEATKFGLGAGGETKNSFTALGLAENINRFKEQHSDRHIQFVLIGDDSQVQINLTDDVRTAIKELASIAQKSRPVTEVHRAKVMQIWRLQEYFRRVYGMEGAANIGQLHNVFQYSDTAGVEMFATYDNVKHRFIADHERLSKEQKDVTVSDMMIIVDNDASRRSVIEDMKGQIPNVADYVFTLADWTNIAENDAAGLSSRNAYVFYDYESARLGTKVNTGERKKVYDIMLTATSRARGKVNIISTELKSERNDNLTVHEDTNASLEAQVMEFQANNDVFGYRAKYIASLLDGNKTEGAEIVPTRTPSETGMRRGNLVLEDDIAAAEEYALTKQLETEITSKHKKLSEIIFKDIDKSTDPKKMLEDDMRHEKNKAIFLLHAVQNPHLSEEQTEKIMTQVHDHIKKVKNLMDKHTPGNNFKEQTFFETLFSTANAPEIMTALGNAPGAISMPLFEGTIKGESFQMTPALVTVIGMYEGKPIIDIYDVVHYGKVEGTDRSLSQVMMAYTVKAAVDSGYIVNNAVLSVFEGDGPDVSFVGSTNMSHKYISEVLAKNENKFNEAEFADSLADESVFFSQEREDFAPHGTYSMFMGDKKVSVLRTFRKYEAGVMVKSYEVQEGSKKYRITQEEFDKLEPSSVKHERNMLYSHGGTMFSERGYTYASTNHDIKSMGNWTRKETDLTEKQKLEVSKTLYLHYFDQKLKMNTALHENIVLNDNTIYRYALVAEYDIETAEELLGAELAAKARDEGLLYVVHEMPQYSYQKPFILDKDMNQLMEDYFEATGTEKKLLLEEIESLMNFDEATNEYGDVQVSNMEEVNKALVQKNLKTLKMMNALKNGQQVKVVLRNSDNSTRRVSPMTMEEVFADMESKIEPNEYLDRKTLEKVELTDKAGKKHPMTAVKITTKLTDKVFTDKKSNPTYLYVRARNVVTDNNRVREQSAEYVAQLIKDFNENFKDKARNIRNIKGDMQKTEATRLFGELKKSEAVEFIMQNFKIDNIFSQEYINFAFNMKGENIDTQIMFNKEIHKKINNAVSVIGNALTDLANRINDVGFISNESLKKMMVPIWHSGEYQLNNMIVDRSVNKAGVYLQSTIEKDSNRNGKTEIEKKCGTKKI